jgi:hypothetical protein
MRVQIFPSQKSLKFIFLLIRLIILVVKSVVHIFHFLVLLGSSVQIQLNRYFFLRQVLLPSHMIVSMWLSSQLFLSSFTICGQ